MKRREKYLIITFFVSMLGLQLWVADAQSKQISDYGPLVKLAALEIAKREADKIKILEEGVVERASSENGTQATDFVWYNPFTWF